MRQSCDIHETDMRKSTPLIQLQTIADMFVLVCDLRYLVTPLMGGHMAMARLTSVHGKNDIGAHIHMLDILLRVNVRRHNILNA